MRTKKINCKIKNCVRYKILPRYEGELILCAYPNGDINKFGLTETDLQNIKLMDQQSQLNPDLISRHNRFTEAGNIYSLMAEGVLSGQKTGADLGIYDYEPILENKLDDIKKYLEEGLDFSLNRDMSKYNMAYEDVDEYDFSRCILAEENPLGGEETQIVNTFKGYLDIDKNQRGIIRKCDTNNAPFYEVYLPEYYVRKYQLRNGDEICCTCKEQDGKMYASALFTINGQSYRNWECERPWFNDLMANKKVQKLHGAGDYTEQIARKFGLTTGDNVFLYINKNTRKAQILPSLMEELSDMFDRVIYINPQYRGLNFTSNAYNLAKFCTLEDEHLRDKITVALLGANYAKRLIEMGQNVVVVIDDIDGIVSLDIENSDDMPVCKTILGSAKACKIGSNTLFTLIPLRSDVVNRLSIHNIFRGMETLGIVIDNNEIDLYNSYRI